MEPPSPPYFRDLYNKLYQCKGNKLVVYRDVLMPWLESGQQALAIIEAAFAKKGPYERYYDPRRWTMYNLYALSRVMDFLLLGFQPKRLEVPQPLRSVSFGRYKRFFTRMGLTPVAPDVFTPFYHEIVQVEQAADPDHPIQIRSILWPGFMLGELMVSRAGVKVIGGVRHVIKDIAEKSLMCDTYLRRCRPTYDLGKYSGHNSQWTTPFRRDYLSQGLYHYNFDGTKRLHELQPGPSQSPYQGVRNDLTWDKRVELCKHRCFIRSKPELDPKSYSKIESEHIKMGQLDEFLESDQFVEPVDASAS